MQMKVVSGNEAVATAVKLARVGVISLYPITPQTTIIEKLSEMRARGEIDAEIVRVESEHSAMAAAYGAAISGVRAFTATASQGLLYMHEMVWWVSGSRVPLVMVVATRAVGAPWNIWNEHTDFISERESGWIMGFAMNPQEALDMTLQAFRISEDERVFLPVMVGMDGFILSHTKTPVKVPSQDNVDAFLPPRNQPYIIDPENPIGMGNMFQPIEYMKLRESINSAIINSEQVIKEIGREYENVNLEGDYSILNPTYKVEDSEYVIVLMGAWSGDAMEAIDSLRARGKRVGMLRIRYLRPWSEREINEALRGRKGVLVLERATSFGRKSGPLYLEVKSSLDLNKTGSVSSVIAGLGGVSVSKRDIELILEKFIYDVETGKEVENYWYYPEKVKPIEPRIPRSIE
jgi:Pyruvate:ferredoxin oxidoreductase and related 2-oxoacid:ferredoxin oxidoreductases, alpha subunit